MGGNSTRRWRAARRAAALSAGLVFGLVGLGATPGSRPAGRPAASLRVLAGVPNDPSYAGSQAPYLGALNLPSAWDRTTGSDSVVVAVVDSGVDPTHPDLAGHVVAGRNIVSGGADTTDEIGHGTKMAGILGAVTNNGLGLAGVAWSVKIMPVKVTGPSGATSDSNVAAGITWAVDHGARVVNLSLGAPGDDHVLQQAVDYATGHDVLVVAAAGNNASTVPEFPAACRGVVAVGATDAAGRRAPFSNSGPWVDVNAPGVDVLTTGVGGGYTRATGTSPATALVAGVAVLLRAADPGAGQADIADRLRRSALGRGPVGQDGVDASGVVDAAAALRLPARRAASGPSRGAGYLMIGNQGKVDAFGAVGHRGDVWGDLRQARAAGLESRPAGDGYWVVDSDGAVAAFGAATDYGGLTAVQRAAAGAAVALRATPAGDGYWIFTDAGRAFAFGSARPAGDLAGVRLNRPVVAAAVTPSGRGYLMVADDGGVFAFGDARFAGSMGGRPLNAPIRAAASDPDGDGYWMAAADGGVFAFRAPYRGSLGATRLNAPIAGLANCGAGYLLVASDGGVFDFSDCPFAGSLGGGPSPNPVVAMAASA